MSDKIIEINGLVKRFGRFTALNGVDLTVNQGETFGFIGPNGAGKSTIIRSILGILQPTSGSVKVFGQNAWNNSTQIHKRIAYVPGDVNLWPNMTGGEVIDFFKNLRGGTDEGLRARLIEEFELDTSKKCRTYSKGNRQKVALVSAFATDADLYILDEPTSGLDPLMAKVFFKWVREFKNRGKTVFLSSHILQEVEGLCDRISIIRSGNIVESGTIADLRKFTKVSVRVVANKPIVGLKKIEGIGRFEGSEFECQFEIESSRISDVVKVVAPLDPTVFECSPPNLEDLFMRFYEEDCGNSLAKGGNNG